jgi:FAD/FMN-containing dehydrogenase
VVVGVSKVGHYLQEHLLGEVVSSTDARRHFATDGSIFAMAPALVVYPQNENDVRKVARFSWQLAERNRIVPITARGSGTDLGGAAIGSGISLVFPAHMNRIVELDGKTGVAIVEPGINYGKLQQALMTHGRFLPPAPASLEYSTVGGAVANNASGEKSVKYGDTRNYVKSVRAVLANGEVIQTGRLSKREVGKKLGLSTFEGEIYRGIDTLIEEHQKTIDAMQLPVTKNSAGYDLLGIKHRDGSIDLTPLLVGSQGTLAFITEVTLDTEAHNPETTLLLVGFDDVSSAGAAIEDLRRLDEIPSAIEMVDRHLIEQVRLHHPNILKGILEQPYPKIMLLVEFDNSERLRKKAVRQSQKIFEKHQAASVDMENDPEKQHELWKIRQLPALLGARNDGNNRAIPVIDDGAVPPEKFTEYLNEVYDMFKQNRVEAAVWGHAGDGNLHMQPHLDISQVGDRQKAFKLLDEYSRLVIKLGGTTSAAYGDGRLRAPYLQRLYGNEAYALLQKVKHIFDPYGMLNPGVKIDVTLDDIKPLIRSDYTHGSYNEHLPRS